MCKHCIAHTNNGLRIALQTPQVRGEARLVPRSGEEGWLAKKFGAAVVAVWADALVQQQNGPQPRGAACIGASDL